MVFNKRVDCHDRHCIYNILKTQNTSNVYVPVIIMSKAAAMVLITSHCGTIPLLTPDGVDSVFAN